MAGSISKRRSHSSSAVSLRVVIEVVSAARPQWACGEHCQKEEEDDDSGRPRDNMRWDIELLAESRMDEQRIGKHKLRSAAAAAAGLVSSKRRAWRRPLDCLWQVEEVNGQRRRSFRVTQCPLVWVRVFCRWIDHEPQHAAEAVPVIHIVVPPQTKKKEVG